MLRFPSQECLTPSTLQRYINQFKTNKYATSYMKQRGFKTSTLNHFNVGFAYSKDKESRFIDKPSFTSRIMIPYFKGSEIIGYTGRNFLSETILKSLEDKGVLIPKYKNSKFNTFTIFFYVPKSHSLIALFPKFGRNGLRILSQNTNGKAQTIYNVNALHDVSSTAIIFEGQLNVMAFHQASLDGVTKMNGIDARPIPISLGGKELNEYHLDTMHANGIKNIILAMDSDLPGMKGTIEAIKKVTSDRRFWSCSVITFPLNKDMADILKEPKLIRQVMNGVRDWSQWMADYLNYLSPTATVERVHIEFKDLPIPTQMKVTGDNNYARYINLCIDRHRESEEQLRLAKQEKENEDGYLEYSKIIGYQELKDKLLNYGKKQ